ncbi:hypothetical protein [Halalkalibacter sp. APA_J-10(15)]|uniref:hypothetical protein n=1 Tax=Halalkalibacter sp. APA_J-10(15) TaxID=2933805 RepID=UPI001FF1A365|nr:hypothetical protein [Halalkalibacter sp. APA_J-10(15)]MCK0470377.1 hypothetical protein [Halalkalibacter sp. APA_J-10(15)]
MLDVMYWIVIIALFCIIVSMRKFENKAEEKVDDSQIDVKESIQNQKETIEIQRELLKTQKEMLEVVKDIRNRLN